MSFPRKRESRALDPCFRRDDKQGDGRRHRSGDATLGRLEHCTWWSIAGAIHELPLHFCLRRLLEAT
jgi:hypothetical protein